MAIDKLINHSQGEEIITLLQSIANNIEAVGNISLESLGMGYTACSTAAGTAAKTAALAGYALEDGGLVSVKFTNAVGAGATLNINSKGAKAIYYKGSAITANIIKAGDIATFIYTNNQYQLINLDNPYSQAQSDALNSGITSSLVTQIGTNKNNILYNTNQGVKNIFRTPTIDTTSSGINVKTLSDGQLKVTSAGTNTSAVYIDLEASLGSKYVGYKLSGGSVNVGVYISNSGGAVACSVRGDEVSIPSNATNKLFLTIKANTPAFEETIYVMIREFGDATYQPYAMSNVELTAAIQALQAQLANQ